MPSYAQSQKSCGMSTSAQSTSAAGDSRNFLQTWLCWISRTRISFKNTIPNQDFTEKVLKCIIQVLVYIMHYPFFGIHRIKDVTVLHGWHLAVLYRARPRSNFSPRFRPLSGRTKASEIHGAFFLVSIAPLKMRFYLP
jgi:hypothetical protein